MTTKAAPAAKKAKKAPAKKAEAGRKKTKKTAAKSEPARGRKGRSFETPVFSERNVKREWLVVDLNGKVLGRAASQISNFLRGKHKPTYTPFTDTGDFVVVVNAGKFELTGNKWVEKPYRRYTGYLGGLRTVSARDLMAKNPKILVERAVWGMLPKTRLGKCFLKKLKIYVGPEHPHGAQNPRVVQLD